MPVKHFAFILHHVGRAPWELGWTRCNFLMVLTPQRTPLAFNQLLG